MIAVSQIVKLENSLLPDAYTAGYNKGKTYGETHGLTKIDSVFYLDFCTKDNIQYFVIVLSNGKTLFLDKFAANDSKNAALMNQVDEFLKDGKIATQHYIMDNNCT